MPEDYSTEIAEIEAVLNSGITKTKEDGQEIEFDRKDLRRRLRELKQKAGLIKRRPRWGSINLGD